MSRDQRKNTGVSRTIATEPPVLRYLRARTFAITLAKIYGGQAMPRGQTVSRDLGNYIRELRGDRTQVEVARAAAISYPRWRQIEGGEVPPADTLWDMARALGATASQIERIFELAQYDEMFEHLTRIGSSRTPGVPSTAELGISADPTLNRESKAKLLDYLQMLRATEETP